MAQHTAKRLISGSALQAVNFGSQIVVAFFLTPFVIHSLGDRMYGFWTLVGAFIGYYGMLDLGLDAAVSRHLAGALGKGSTEECADLFSTALQLYTALGFVIVLVTVAMAFVSPFFVHNPQDAALFAKVILILGFSLGLSFPAKTFAGLLNAELRFDALALVDILTLLLRSTFVVIALLAGGRILALAWVTFICSLPGVAAYVLLSRRQCPWLRFKRQPWFGQSTKSLLSYGVYALVGNLSNQLRFNVDAFVIAAFVGLASVTHFRIAGLMATYFMSFMIALVTTIQPWFSRMDGAGDQNAIRRVFLLSTKLSICVASFIGFGLIAWGKSFIHCWVGTSYLDAYPCLVALVPGYIIALGQFPSISLMFGTSKHRFLALINSAEGVANLILSIWLAGKLGILGVALGTLIPMVLVKLTVQPIYVCRISSVPYGTYMRELGRSALIVAAALVVPGVITARFVTPSYYSLIAVAVGSLACYAPVVFLLQFTKRERESLKRIALPSLKATTYSKVLPERAAR
jgi:O-antigen/teichoic acid export membrane protein